MLELAILGLLVDEDLHGYELKRRLTDVLGARSSVSDGSLYPALGRLEKTAAVKAVTANPEGDEPPPATGSLGAELALFRRRKVGGGGARSGRTRKVYGITNQGRRVFEDLLTADAVNLEDDRAFNLRVAFARFLTSEARVRLLERRRASLLERLTGTRGQCGHDYYANALIEHCAATTEQEISWLDDLIARERAQTSKGN